MNSVIIGGSDQEVVENIKQLSLVFSDVAERTDREGPLNEQLRHNISELIKIRFLGASIPAEYGGLSLSAPAKRKALMTISAACGVTAFTQQQLHAGGNFVSHVQDEDLRRELLPQFASGDNICGVGFSHLRRLGPPKVKAVRTSQGFTISGEIPWISAWSLLDSFILGAVVNDGAVIFCYLPIAEYRSALRTSQPMELSTLTASETVQLDISEINLPARYVLSENPPDHMIRTDFRGITGHFELPLGCALGSASFLRRLGQQRSRPTFTEWAEKIETKVAALEDSSLNWNASRSEEPDYKANALKVRTAVIKLAIDAAAAGISAAGGSAHLMTSPAQRRYRESAFYATQAQTLDIQESLLEAFIDG